ncbi:uncharacterized protein LOC132035097 [Lycium ferocissimum]|uniref:uncharacterized protein LOC132035097 n=1 Tax=Lycium ferocissimum TaxID=112874 RepID=UPI002815A0D3|nr:uncharacterized protein LOC132035097 [Lycium ferocissimum]
MTVTSTVGETKITVIRVEAATLITTKVVGEVNMMRRGTTEVGLMEVPPLLAEAPPPLTVALFLEGAPLHVEQPLLEMLVQVNVITMAGLLLQRVSHRGVDMLVLATSCRILMLMIKKEGRRPRL